MEHQSQGLTENPLLEQLLGLHGELRDAIRARWDRSLPLADELLDRWERAKHLGFGEGASIYDSAVVIGDVKVGAGTWVGPQTFLDGSGGLTIGSTCSISTGVQIYTHDSVAWALTGGQAEYERSPTVIGDRCYVGPQTVITRGVTVGEGSVIGAHSLVRESIPPGSIAFGVPARVRGRVLLDGNQVRMELDETSGT